MGGVGSQSGAREKDPAARLPTRGEPGLAPQRGPPGPEARVSPRVGTPSFTTTTLIDHQMMAEDKDSQLEPCMAL